MISLGYNPQQPRNKDGEWGSGGGGRSSKGSKSNLGSGNAAVDSKISDIASKRGSASIEHAYILSPSGKQLVYKKGKAREVNMTSAEYSKKKGNIAVHNHPGGCSFSSADIVNAHANSVKQEWVVSKNFAYQITPNKKLCGTDVTGKRFDKMESKASSLRQQAIRKWGPKYSSGKITKQHAEEEASHWINIKMAKTFKYKYKRVPLNA